MIPIARLSYVAIGRRVKSVGEAEGATGATNDAVALEPVECDGDPRAFEPGRSRQGRDAGGWLRAQDVDHAAADLAHRALEGPLPPSRRRGRAPSPSVSTGARRTDTRRIGASPGSAPDRDPSTPGSSDPDPGGPPSRSRSRPPRPVEPPSARSRARRAPRSGERSRRWRQPARRPRSRRPPRPYTAPRPEAPATPRDRSAPGHGVRPRPPAPHDATTPRGGCSRAPPRRAARRPSWRAPALAPWGRRA